MLVYCLDMPLNAHVLLGDRLVYCPILHSYLPSQKLIHRNSMGDLDITFPYHCLDITFGITFWVNFLHHFRISLLDRTLMGPLCYFHGTFMDRIFMVLSWDISVTFTELSGTFMDHFCYFYETFLKLIWYLSGPFLLLSDTFLVIYGLIMVLFWDFVGTLMVHFWYFSGTFRILICYFLMLFWIFSGPFMSLFCYFMSFFW